MNRVCVVSGFAFASVLAMACQDKAELAVYKGKATPTDPATIGSKTGAKADSRFEVDGGGASQPISKVSAASLLSRAKPLLGALAQQADNPANPSTTEKIDLGHLLYFDPRLSKSQKISCNTCHDLASYGVDIREKNGARSRTSEGHDAHFGERNTPTVYNAAFHMAQFWDGRAVDVEDQATKPILNPIEMAMDDDAAVLAALKAVPQYVEMFAAAFPESASDPITMANLSKAIGAYERKLVTPAPFDRFMGGDLTALDEAQLLGLQYFLDVGCTQCHSGPAVGGMQFQKLGTIKPWPDLVDEGRAAHTKNAIDKFVFKVPSLRNVTETGPWLHDGSFTELEAIVGKMAEFQSARGKVTLAETEAIVAFLGSLKGELPKELIKVPELPGIEPAVEPAKPSPI